MTDKTFDTLKQNEASTIELNSFTDEQVDAVIIYLAKLARETLDKHGATDDQKRAKQKQFMAILDSWPKDFRQRVMDRVINSGCGKIPNAFWAEPADAIIEATKLAEFRF